MASCQMAFVVHRHVALVAVVDAIPGLVVQLRVVLRGYKAMGCLVKLITRLASFLVCYFFLSHRLRHSLVQHNPQVLRQIFLHFSWKCPKII